MTSPHWTTELSRCPYRNPISPRRICINYTRGYDAVRQRSREGTKEGEAKGGRDVGGGVCNLSFARNNEGLNAKGAAAAVALAANL